MPAEYPTQYPTEPPTEYPPLSSPLSTPLNTPLSTAGGDAACQGGLAQQIRRDVADPVRMDLRQPCGSRRAISAPC